MSATALLEQVRRLRASYQRVVQSLPWLDAARWEDDPLAFGAFASDPALPATPRVVLPPDGPLPDARTLVRWAPERSGPLQTLHERFEAMARAGLPLAVLHTDLSIEDIRALAAAHPRLQLVIESGPLKILYFIEPIERLMRERRNVWLCTANLCNWLGLERLCAAGLGDRLLFGTHAPRFNAHVAMGPVVMGRMDADEQRAIAGDNLRRLLGLPVTAPAQTRFEAGPPFVIDAHGHTGPPGRFPVPDEGFAPADWLRFMDACAIEQLFLCPIEAINDPAVEPRAQVADLLAAAPERFRYFEVFHPGSGAEMVARIERSLADPACAGIKLHPSMHGVPADDDAYAPAFALAERTGAALLTHSWEASATNPTQHLSLPARFERHLREHPRTRLVLGHAGGRPSTIDRVAELCARYPEVCVDIAGDYFDSGLVEMLCARIGAERVLFASDVNWIDPRGSLAAVLASRLSDEDALRVLRTNALRVYAH
ncbi:MAG: amidohydrolase family protein [Armatimonadota bacterium]